MKVNELIEVLKDMPQDAVVGVKNAYLFPEDIIYVLVEDIEGEIHAVIYPD